MTSGVNSITNSMGLNEQETLFTAQLKEAGKDLHREVENTPIIKAMFSGKITEEEYTSYLSCLHALYQQLEIELDLNEANPVIKPLLIPGLYRTKYIKEDLKLFGDEEHKPHEKAISYQSHLKILGQYFPHRLIAHAYLRYLGDLFGGMMIARQLKDQFEGKLNFYDFSALCEHQGIRSPIMFANNLLLAVQWKCSSTLTFGIMLVEQYNDSISFSLLLNTCVNSWKLFSDEYAVTWVK